MNIPIVKLDLDSIVNLVLIWFMNKINIPVLYSCLLCSIIFASLLLPFMFAFSLCLIKITARIDRRQMQKKLTKAKDRNPPITAHTLTSVWPSCFLRCQVCCTYHWQPNSIHVTVRLGLNLGTRPHLTLRKKEEKTKFWGRLVESVVLQKNSSEGNTCPALTL